MPINILLIVEGSRQDEALLELQVAFRAVKGLFMRVSKEVEYRRTIIEFVSTGRLERVLSNIATILHNQMTRPGPVKSVNLRLSIALLAVNRRIQFRLLPEVAKALHSAKVTLEFVVFSRKEADSYRSKVK